MSVREWVLTTTIVIFGIHAGLYATFAYAVMPGLRRADPMVGVVAMQRINAAILNPVFMLIFAGGVIVGAAAVVGYWSGPLRWWVLGGLVLCVVGMLITVVVNVPLNNRLEAAGAVSGAEAARVWSDFAEPWVRWNIARALVHTAAFGVLVVGVITRRA